MNPVIDIVRKEDHKLVIGGLSVGLDCSNSLSLGIQSETNYSPVEAIDIPKEIPGLYVVDIRYRLVKTSWIVYYSIKEITFQKGKEIVRVYISENHRKLDYNRTYVQYTVNENSKKVKKSKIVWEESDFYSKMFRKQCGKN